MFRFGRTRESRNAAALGLQRSRDLVPTTLITILSLTDTANTAAVAHARALATAPATDTASASTFDGENFLSQSSDDIRPGVEEGLVGMDGIW